MTEDRRHRTAGGSSAEIWSNCTGYLGLKAQLPPQLPTEHTERGTKAHDLCEIVLDAFLQKKITGQSNPEVVKIFQNYDDPEIAETAINYAEEVWEKVLNESITGKAYGIEDEFVLSDKLDIGGFADFWAVWIDNRAKRVLEITDFKNGYVPAGWVQLICYAVCARQEFRAAGKDIDYANIHIYQPKVNQEMQSQKLTAKQLDTWEKKFLKAVEAAYRNPKFKVGDWCEKCNCRTACPKYLASPRANTSLKILDHRIDSFPEPEMVPDNVMVEIITRSDEISKFLKLCKAAAIARHISGNPIAGLKVVRGTGRRNWIDNQPDVEEVLKKHGVEDIYTLKLKGIGQIETQLKDSLGVTKKKAQELIQDITYVKPSKPQLVPESDPRPAALTFDDLLPDLRDDQADE